MTRETYDLLDSILCTQGDFAFAWVSEDHSTIKILDNFDIEGNFQDLVEEFFHKHISRNWKDGYKTVRINGKTVNCVRFSYLKDHPEAFPELDDFRELKSYTELQLQKKLKYAVICEHRWGGSNCITNEFKTANAARDWMEEYFQWLKHNGFIVEKTSDGFIAYWKSYPWISYMKATLVN